MNTLKTIAAFSLLLAGLVTTAQPTDSAYAMLSEVSAIESDAESALLREAALARKMKTTKHANFRSNLAYHGLNAYIKANLEFPEAARITGKTGVVKVAFDILPDGRIANIEVIETPLKVLSDALMRTLESMPQWSPAYQSGMPIKTRQQVHVDFSLM